MEERKQSSDNRSNEPKEKSTGRKVWSGIWKTLATIIMLSIIAGCIGGCYMAMIIFDKFEQSDTINLDLDMLKLNYTTILYQMNPETGTYEEMQRLEGLQGSRIWTDYEDMPQHLFDALIAVEDKNFMEHTGVDWRRTIIAAADSIADKFGLSILPGEPGASTITQQLVRNVTSDREVSWDRKLREIFRAVKMERKYSKDQILESYLNMASFGNNTNGIQAAANLYFDKDVKDLSVAQCAAIVGITKHPVKYDPYLHYDENKKRKETVLFLMHEQGKLTDEEYEEALAEEIVFNRENNQKRLSNNQSYFTDFLMTQVIEDLSEELQISPKEASDRLYQGGYRIYTTVDPTVQAKLEMIYENPEEYMPPVLNKEYPQSAFIITDPNGAIRGIVGGIGKKEGARVWNRATDTQRQPGSTIKPISTYLLAVENDIINWSSMVLDGPYCKYIEGQPLWKPIDFYNNTLGFLGYLPAVEALQRSTNMIPVRLVDILTPEAIWNFLKNSLNIQSLTKSDIAPSPMSLGALTNGVTPLEMAGAYQIFANGGTYTEPYTYTTVLDSRGNVILRRDIVPKRVVSFETATVMNKLMQQVVAAWPGTGRLASLADIGIPVAGKTGTTDKDVDQWFIGVTPYYVGVCWMGYDDQFQTKVNENGEKVVVKDKYGNKLANSIRYNKYPPPILWNTVMKEVHKDLEPKDFISSSNVVPVTYCKETGYAATDECTNTAIGWYKTNTIPAKCPLHSESYITDYHVAGEKPWIYEDAVLTEEWAFVYMYNSHYEEQVREAFPYLYEYNDKHGIRK